jgi:hypothetical protein
MTSSVHSSARFGSNKTSLTPPLFFIIEVPIPRPES